jgi:hypothetical protein
VHVATLWKAKKKVGVHIPPDEGVSTGGDDWPDAYRERIQHLEDAEACVVTFWHHHWQQPVFVLYYSLLFGNPLSVTSFNRFPKFIEAVVRRLVWILFSMYFDDATIQDWNRQLDRGQNAVQTVLTSLGSPFSLDKRQPMGKSADFLGLEHDTESVTTEGHMTFWVRERIENNMEKMMTQAKASNFFPPGTASKMYGTANFWETGTFGKMGRAGLNAIKDRQYSSDNQMTAEIHRSFDILRVINELRPKRIVQIIDSPVERFCAASDAAYEGTRGSGGYLMVIQPCREAEERWGRMVQIPTQVYDIWGQQETYIAQLEMMMVLAAIIEDGAQLKYRRGIWFVDNVAALMALVRGRSNQPALDQMALLIHTALFTLRAWVYFEWVESKANWSDGISREGLKDKWHQENHFQASTSVMPHLVLRLPMKPGLMVFEYLFGAA